jgi:hypothetical protein
LPLLGAGLMAATTCYLVRGLLIIPQTPYVLRHPEAVRFLIISAISLCVGLIYLGGVVSLYRHGRPCDACCGRF